MKKLLSLLSIAAFALSFSLAGPAFAKSENAATGIGKEGTPPGQAQKESEGATTAKENAPGQAKKASEAK